MKIQIKIEYPDSPRKRRPYVFEDLKEILIGRDDINNDVHVDVDLMPDTTVSRKHAVLRYDLSAWWIEDTHSKRGTRVNNDIELLGQDKPYRLKSGDTIQLGKTTLTVLFEENAADTLPLNAADAPIGMEAYAPKDDTGAFRRMQSETQFRIFQFNQSVREIMSYRRGQQELLRAFIKELRAMFPRGNRFTILLIEGDDRELVPREFYPTNVAYISFELSRKVIECQQSLLWQRKYEVDKAITVGDMTYAMYAPMIVNGRVIGVIHVDTNEQDVIFTKQDLDLLDMVAGIIGSAIMAGAQNEMEHLPSVFISYKHEDKDFVHKLEKDLRKRRIRPWFDDRLQVGESSWRQKLAIMIRDTDAFLVVLSPLAVASPHVLWEIDTALNHNKKVYPIMIENTEMPVVLGNVQYAKMPREDTALYETELRKLVDQLLDLVENNK